MILAVDVLETVGGVDRKVEGLSRFDEVADREGKPPGKL